MLVDIKEENLKCHHILFIRDVISSTHDSRQNCYKIPAIGLSYTRARLSGVIVSISNSTDSSVRIDDGTATIRILIPSTIKRTHSPYVLSDTLSVFGMVDQIGDEVILRCGGYSIGNIQSELYHALRAIEENPLFHKKDEMSASKSTVNQQAFHSLSSLPSPKRPVPPNFMQSPMSDQSRFLWSPDHHFATSTPIRAVTRSIMTNPPPKMALAEVDEFDEFDEFDDIDVDAFEEQAMNTVRTGHP